ncbi:Hypothetical protein, putative membrane protein [Pseudomonas brassicacearum subsp. brassicacearum NFM421]|uniref:Uncharacterized protein n=1 Tax=Pseudomonas brassicacearum (strain NFM421) TaxID=994484 RepID=F2KG56_PSEBN|nr:Hypothetical protein, putative membrane protein [Pseudomonas brassicacearum subsp. brassicacearum NFM421]
MQPDKPMARAAMNSTLAMFFMFCLLLMPHCVAFDPWPMVLKLTLEKGNRVWFLAVSSGCFAAARCASLSGINLTVWKFDGIFRMPLYPSV